MRRFCVQIKFRGLICRLGIQPAHPLHRPQGFEFRQGEKLRLKGVDLLSKLRSRAHFFIGEPCCPPLSSVIVGAGVGNQRSRIPGAAQRQRFLRSGEDLRERAGRGQLDRLRIFMLRKAVLLHGVPIPHRECLPRSIPQGFVHAARRTDIGVQRTAQSVLGKRFPHGAAAAHTGHGAGRVFVLYPFVFQISLWIEFNIKLVHFLFLS